MKNIIASLVISFIVSIAGLIIGRHLVLKPVYDEIESHQGAKKKLEIKVLELDARLEMAKNQKPVEMAEQSFSPVGPILVATKEGELVSELLKAAGGNSIKVESFDLLNVFQLKKDSDSDFDMPKISSIADIEIDEQGNPVDRRFYEDSDADNSVDLLPLSLKFSSDLGDFGKFMGDIQKGLPLFFLKGMTVQEVSRGRVQGDVLLVFPLRSSL